MYSEGFRSKTSLWVKSITGSCLRQPKITWGGAGGFPKNLQLKALKIPQNSTLKNGRKKGSLK